MADWLQGFNEYSLLQALNSLVMALAIAGMVALVFVALLAGLGGLLLQAAFVWLVTRH